MQVAIYVSNIHAYNFLIGISGIYAQIGVGIFGSGTYLSVRCEVDVAVGCGLVHMCCNHCSLYSYSIRAICYVAGIFVTFCMVSFSPVHVCL